MSYFPTGKHTYANVTVPYTGNITLATGNVSYSTASVWSTGSSKVKITDSDIEIEGLSLKRTLQAVNQRLAIMIPNPSLEREFEELRAIGDEYRRLERELQEQLKMWNTLKNTDNK